MGERERGCIRWERERERERERGSALYGRGSEIQCRGTADLAESYHNMMKCQFSLTMALRWQVYCEERDTLALAQTPSAVGPVAACMDGMVNLMIDLARSLPSLHVPPPPCSLLCPLTTHFIAGQHRIAGHRPSARL